jgi:hypothetical protein
MLAEITVCPAICRRTVPDLLCGSPRTPVAARTTVDHLKREVGRIQQEPLAGAVRLHRAERCPEGDETKHRFLVIRPAKVEHIP